MKLIAFTLAAAFKGRNIMRIKFFAVLLSLIALSGCGVVAQIQNYRAVDAYQECLEANRTAVDKCEADRLSMIAANRKLGKMDDVTVRREGR